jgi:hypothetical protein
VKASNIGPHEIFEIYSVEKLEKLHLEKLQVEKLHF